MFPLWFYSKRHEQLILPDLCAYCVREKASCAYEVTGKELEPSGFSSRYVYVLTHRLRVPLCEHCYQQLTHFWRRLKGFSILAGIIASCVIYYLMTKDQNIDPDREYLYWIMAFVVGGLAALLFYCSGMMINGVVNPASEIVNFDVDRQQFTFRNEEYQTLVMELNREGYYRDIKGVDE
ncbi:MAG TPA: hypothetical protein PLN21_17710 [Gemmatales bacterium]|nr:hypothetical protein [Gemmatales bacterium]